MTRLVAVFGATGAQGGGLVRAALADPGRRFRVRAVTRKPDSAGALALRDAGADVVAADLDDAASVERAMRGADAAYCVTNFWEHFSPAKEIAQARTMAEAAARTGVKHVVWSTLEDTRTFVKPGTAGWKTLGDGYLVPHFDAKGEANAFFLASGVPTTLFHTSFYWDNLVHFGMQPQRGDDGVLQFVLPMGDAKLPGIAAADIGACAYAILARGDEFAGRSVGVAGEHLTGAQMAEQLSQALGEPVRHAALSTEQYAALGFPGADDLANMFKFKHDFERTYCESRSVERTRALHPGVRTFAQWLAENAKRMPIAPRQR
ncbi:MAG TPA: NmrA/HSCARG family protein [Casimicrobiaceae bacterium]|nr:NmrA/HSCARG family protein [Casimicrobiaceae bacterium]